MATDRPQIGSRLFVLCTPESRPLDSRSLLRLTALLQASIRESSPLILSSDRSPRLLVRISPANSAYPLTPPEQDQTSGWGQSPAPPPPRSGPRRSLLCLAVSCLAHSSLALSTCLAFSWLAFSTARLIFS